MQRMQCIFEKSRRFVCPSTASRVNARLATHRPLRLRVRASHPDFRHAGMVSYSCPSASPFGGLDSSPVRCRLRRRLSSCRKRFFGGATAQSADDPAASCLFQARRSAARLARGAAETRILLRVFQKIDDLDQLVLGFIDAGNIVESDFALHLIVATRTTFADAHQTGASRPPPCIARRYIAFTSSAIAFVFSSFRSTMAMSAPSFASPSAIARPMP